MLGFNPLYRAVLGLMGGPQPALSLDFLAGGLNPAVVTFSRASNATQFDSAGRLVWAPHNLCTRGNDASTAWSINGTFAQTGPIMPSGRQMWVGTFDGAPSSGFAVSPVAIPANSPLCLQVKLANSSTNWARVLLFSVGAPANNVRVWVNTTTGVVGTVSSGGTWTGASASITPLSGGVYQVALKGVNASADTGILVAPTDADGSVTRVPFSSMAFGEVQLEYNSAIAPTAYNDTTGTAYYGPRFDYNPQTLAARGVLVEEARTNLITGSRFWGVVFAGPTCVRDAVSPLGLVNDAYTFTEGTVAVQHITGCGASATTFTAATHTLTAFVKAGTANRCQLACSNVISAEFANFSLVGPGSVLLQNVSSTATISACGSGWYRVGMTVLTGAASGNLFVAAINGDLAGRLPSFVGTGLTLLVWGGQAELGAFASSHIPTFDAAATRTNDIMFVATSLFYNTLGGTLVVSGEVTQPGGPRSAFNFNNNSFAERLQLRWNSVWGTVCTIANVVQAGGLSSAAAAGPFKLAFQFVTGAQQLSVNGGAVAGGTSPIPTAVDRLSIGSAVSGGESLFGWIKTVAYYDKRNFTNLELQALTS